jgi:hypothetical protein
MVVACRDGTKEAEDADKESAATHWDIEPRG